MDRLRLEFAAEGFLSAMRREYVGRSKSADIEIRSLKDYPADDQGALLNALKSALRMTSPETDAAFQTWLINRQAKKAS